MSMLAEQRRRQKYSVDPRGLNWSKDESKFGQRMLERMGWKKGKGLGAKEDGNTEHVKVSLKTDSKGVGCSKSHADNWVAHQDDFNALLSSLNTDHGDQGSDTEKVQSLEETSKSMKGRVHYRKFARGKDLSMYKSNDLDSIFGKRKSKSEPNTPPDASEANSDAESTESNPETGTNDLEKSFGVMTTTSTTSLQDYFAKKMADLKHGHPNSRFNQFSSTAQTGQSGAESDSEAIHVTQGFGFSSFDQSVKEEKLESAAEKEGNSKDSCNADNTCSKRKKSKRKSKKENSDIEDCERSEESVKSKKSKKKDKSEKEKKKSDKKEEMESPVSDEDSQSATKPVAEEKPQKKRKKDKKKTHKDESKELPDVESKSDLEPLDEDKSKKKRKKDKKKELSDVEPNCDQEHVDEDKPKRKSKKDKKKSRKEESHVDPVMSESIETPKSKNSSDDQEKSRKRKRKDQDEMSVKEDMPAESLPKKKKKDKQEKGEKAASSKSDEEEKTVNPEACITDKLICKSEPSQKSEETSGKTDDSKQLDNKNKDLGVRDKLAAAFPGSNVDNIQGYAGGVSLRTTKFKNKKNKRKK